MFACESVFSRKVADLFVRLLGSRNSCYFSYEAIPEDDHGIFVFACGAVFSRKSCKYVRAILGWPQFFSFSSHEQICDLGTLGTLPATANPAAEDHLYRTQMRTP